MIFYEKKYIRYTVTLKVNLVNGSVNFFTIHVLNFYILQWYYNKKIKRLNDGKPVTNKEGLIVFYKKN